MKEDDRVEVSISGLGTLTNFVVAEDRWASSEIEKMRSQPQEFRSR
jgi:fumarylacetoacetate (FAA) hydrolase family protein